MVNQTNEELIPLQYGRMKGADWFPSLYRKPVMILGQGGIGSHLSFLVSRLGCELYTYDHDVYEEHNMSGQLVGKGDLRKNKVDAVKDILSNLSPDCEVSVFGKYEDTSMTNDVVLCGFDNMEARKLAFSKWRDYVLSRPQEERSKYLFMDGRLLAELFQIISITGDRQDLMDRYEKEFLFSDSEVEEENCSFKQTTHCASMIASQMTTFLTNWATNVDKGRQVRRIPFYHEYIAPLNLTRSDYGTKSDNIE